MMIKNPRLSRNFTEAELRCRCGCNQFLIDWVFIHYLQILRDKCGFPLIINSAYRCKPYNEKIGGKVDSLHKVAKAADVALANLTSEEKHRLIKSAFEIFNGIGIAKDFIHIDLRNQPCFWLYEY